MLNKPPGDQRCRHSTVGGEIIPSASRPEQSDESYDISLIICSMVPVGNRGLFENYYPSRLCPNGLAGTRDAGQLVGKLILLIPQVILVLNPKPELSGVAEVPAEP